MNGKNRETSSDLAALPRSSAAAERLPRGCPEWGIPAALGVVAESKILQDRGRGAPYRSVMSIYYIGSYDIDDPAAFAAYPPGVLALLPKYGGRVLASDTEARLVEGTRRSMNAIIEFPSVEAALGLYDDAAYAPLKRIRQAATSNVSMVLARAFASR
jgi:uncharacterized protein (DUF1330 family)